MDIYKKLSFISMVVCFLIFSCSSGDIEQNNQEQETEEEHIEEQQPTEQNQSPNILLIIADDFGLDACPGYSIGSIKPNMPNLVDLMDNGLKFNNAWSNPTCSPTRAGILTGKYGLRTGLIRAGLTLNTSETTIQKHLDDNTNQAYSHAVIGKWHLGRTNTHANEMGITYFAGTTSNISSYTNWTLNINGNSTNSTEYATSKFTDLAIDWINDQTKPWFLWLAYNAPHSPFHLPPNNLHSQGALPSDQASISGNTMPYYMAALEALDTEMGRLINSMSQQERDNTVIIFIGDNGTPGRVAQEYNSRRAKGNVYQGGVAVPMVISGKGVTRVAQLEEALVNTTDLFATIADLAGTGTSQIYDSFSIKNLLSSSSANTRQYNYSEILNDAGTKDVTIRNATHKYILFGDGSEALYDLSENPLENPNLLNPSLAPLSDVNSSIKDDLISQLNTITN
ncbi:sulfatase-like hydrolase/transferase [Seonamhaeicola sp. ML3]|uniref:sulfatase-like hydrolase/transferase n=1 Tax=Seonamhaeicola sp. ML3 TaxID=2937786 RepID=UPI00200DDC7A|nr:sulfatase-like hydrolase/transferase [Seonamhaeicola sp. ML3]